jgi:predicted PurR-regulated permease PerM
MDQERVNHTVILLMTLGITALFLSMIQQFLLTIFLAGLFSALARPVYVRLERLFRGHRHLASVVTLLLVIVIFLVPLITLITIVVDQALNVSQRVTPFVKEYLSSPDAVSEVLKGLPFYDHIAPHRDVLVQKAGQIVSLVSGFLVQGMTSVTLGTANFVFLSFVLLYTMFFFQMDGDKLMRRMLYYLPLKSNDEHLMLEKFTSVTRATLKGTLLIGILQGGLAGLAFWVVGIDNAVFWGTVMAVLSIIPSVGSALVWIPAVIILIAQGHVGAGIGLGLFCGLVVGSLDNILRPILVGKDTKMHELLIFFGTLGGIFMFGISGIFIGPLIASLFQTIWEMYGVAFASVLPDVDEVLPLRHHDASDDAGDSATSSDGVADGDDPASDDAPSNDRSRFIAIDNPGQPAARPEHQDDSP